MSNFKIKLIVYILLIILISGLIFVKINFYKFYSIYFQKKWNFTSKSINEKNKNIIKIQNQGKIFFENEEYNFLKFKLEDNGLKYSDDYN